MVLGNMCDHIRRPILVILALYLTAQVESKHVNMPLDVRDIDRIQKMIDKLEERIDERLDDLKSIADEASRAATEATRAAKADRISRARYIWTLIVTFLSGIATVVIAEALKILIGK